MFASSSFNMTPFFRGTKTNNVILDLHICNVPKQTPPPGVEALSNVQNDPGVPHGPSGLCSGKLSVLRTDCGGKPHVRYEASPIYHAARRYGGRMAPYGGGAEGRPRAADRRADGRRE